MLLQFANWEEIITWFHKNFENNENNKFLIDIDDTLIKCNSYIGSTEWFDEMASKTRHFNLLIKKWIDLLPYLEFDIYDNKIPNFINNMKGEITAITSRHCAVQNTTLKNLQNNNLKIHNVISCGLFQKSRMIENYVQPTLKYNYIFIDDKKEHVLNVHRKFPFIKCIWLNKNKTLLSHLKFKLLHR